MKAAVVAFLKKKTVLGREHESEESPLDMVLLGRLFLAKQQIIESALHFIQSSGEGIDPGAPPLQIGHLLQQPLDPPLRAAFH